MATGMAAVGIALGRMARSIASTIGDIATVFSQSPVV